MYKAFSFRDDPTVPSFDDYAPVAVMDAECAFCSWSARLLHRLDKSGEVRICPIQSPLGAALARHYGLDPSDPVSWLFLDEGRAFVDLEAVIQAGQRMGGWARFTVLFRVFPRPVRDWLYRSVARNRYRLFGKADMCALPDLLFQKRLLQ
ncbi:DUF393 domain-containing protein [Marivivens sp. LCG002]|uniref:thiol-disulfide oxidoreductase DCC family protein n=1 Tax=Marivivens sp. LCG002 TaxID=3051171 RepID=UPI002556324A|nr:DUF393 domain-containing protein [Marivivens sp. LCG002]WIV49840.1 DUF393 domain-containing protein [Marivivens sp. LCG002]